MGSVRMLLTRTVASRARGRIAADYTNAFRKFPAHLGAIR